MKDWIKKNRDTIIVTGVALAATAVTVAVTHNLTKGGVARDYQLGAQQASLIAHEAGVLDTIIAHQEKLKSVIQ